jgi:hypothetical protein
MEHRLPNATITGPSSENNPTTTRAQKEKAIFCIHAHTRAKNTIFANSTLQK